MFYLFSFDALRTLDREKHIIKKEEMHISKIGTQISNEIFKITKYLQLLRKTTENDKITGNEEK